MTKHRLVIEIPKADGTLLEIERCVFWVESEDEIAALVNILGLASWPKRVVAGVGYLGKWEGAEGLPVAPAEGLLSTLIRSEKKALSARARKSITWATHYLKTGDYEVCDPMATVADLLMLTEEDLLGTKNTGPHTVREIRRYLAERGLSLKGEAIWRPADGACGASV